MISEERIRTLVRKRCERHSSISNWAKRTGIPEDIIRSVIYDDARPPKVLLDELGIERVYIYQYKGKAKLEIRKKTGDFGTIYGEFDE